MEGRPSTLIRVRRLVSSSSSSSFSISSSSPVLFEDEDDDENEEEKKNVRLRNRRWLHTLVCLTQVRIIRSEILFPGLIILFPKFIACGRANDTAVPVQRRAFAEPDQVELSFRSSAPQEF